MCGTGCSDMVLEALMASSHSCHTSLSCENTAGRLPGPWAWCIARVS